ncbi:DegV family protein [Anaerobacillus isosaccharinicus]|uniref:DegV family protein n=1 Tax=Anaerobacillus isosaccharinicus TaxID=1532552 RepID=A0A1S2L6Q6_9BACI|nr:DegV family protein [Anaerobacillus isosaccharinicus]MBA5587380.1 DegV family protein [Anaerobacillus isosaccharinicus]QOY34427.1 DegV family protein [Anaerobacillus isosaccharinicus]
MAKVKIITDSTADIPSSIVEELDITVVPLKVLFGEETFEDGVDINATQFYEKLASEQVIPTTSQPTPYQFEEVYKEVAREEETQIISIHLSAKLSGTYQSAFIAKDMVKDQIDVTVVDSKRASYAIGIIVVEVARLAKSGATKEQCLTRLDELLSTSVIYFMVDTLEFLQKNGRIGKASALFGSLLKIKPILSLNSDGEVFPFDKVRGQKKALAKVYDFFDKDFGTQPIHVGISHANAMDVATEIMLEMKSRFNVKSDIITEIGPVIGAHVGPGAIAVTVALAK